MSFCAAFNLTSTITACHREHSSWLPSSNCWLKATGSRLDIGCTIGWQVKWKEHRPFYPVLSAGTLLTFHEDQECQLPQRQCNYKRCSAETPLTPQVLSLLASGVQTIYLPRLSAAMLPQTCLAQPGAIQFEPPHACRWCGPT